MINRSALLSLEGIDVDFILNDFPKVMESMRVGAQRIREIVLSPRNFDPFFTTKAPGKGTGLELSISYQIITERHGGTLECRSHLNQGTTFTVTLPTTLEDGSFAE